MFDAIRFFFFPAVSAIASKDTSTGYDISVLHMLAFESFRTRSANFEERCVTGTSPLFLAAETTLHLCSTRRTAAQYRVLRNSALTFSPPVCGALTPRISLYTVRAGPRVRCEKDRQADPFYIVNIVVWIATFAGRQTPSGPRRMFKSQSSTVLNKEWSSSILCREVHATHMTHLRCPPARAIPFWLSAKTGTSW